MKIKILSAIGLIVSSVVLLNIFTGWTDRHHVLDEKTIRASVAKSTVLLQQSAYTFTNNSFLKCAGCHHNTLTAMVTDLAKKKGVPVIDSLVAHNTASMEYTLQFACDNNHVGYFLQVNFASPYLLLGLAAAKYPANMFTDIAVDYVISQSKKDGSFLTESGRIPLETGDIHLAAMAIRAIELYASPAKQKHVEALVAKTRSWLEKQNPTQQQELSFQLMGMQWCGSSEAQKRKVFQKLANMQNTDGGWSQLTTLKTDAYATGQVLCAMNESGMVNTNDNIYQRGMNYLLKTQDAKGAWEVVTRSFPIQPFVDSQFPPYNRDQFISAAATNWASMALLRALPDKD